LSGSAVLVTGGTGFVGNALVRRLLASGHDVAVLARRSSDRSSLAGLPVVWLEGDLGDADSLERAIGDFAAGALDRGATAQVIHGAALISYRTADAEQSRRMNVEGTRAILDACRIHGVSRVVHVSSVVSVGYARDRHGALTEESDYNGAELLCDYVTTKRAAEDFALSVAGQLDIVVVNPGAIFGRAPQTSNTSNFLVEFAHGRIGALVPPGSVSVVGVEDVADGIVRALERGERGRRYLLCESCLTHRELLGLVAERLGVRPPLATVPAPLWRAAVLGMSLLDRWRPLTKIPPQSARLLGVHFRFDASRARSELGWCPRPFPEVLDDTLAWLRAEGRLPEA
jgi:dihydroflavonol-4-reductase